MKQLNYVGDVTGAIGQVVGPTYNRELLTIYAAEYDAATNRTVVFVRPATRPEVEASSGLRAFVYEDGAK